MKVIVSIILKYIFLYLDLQNKRKRLLELLLDAISPFLNSSKIIEQGLSNIFITIFKNPKKYGGSIFAAGIFLIILIILI